MGVDAGSRRNCLHSLGQLRQRAGLIEIGDALAGAGACVVAFDLDQDGAEDAVESYGDDGLAVSGDVTIEDAVAAAFAAATAISPWPAQTVAESTTTTRSGAIPRSTSCSRACSAERTVPEIPPERWIETMSKPWSSSGS